MNSMRAFGNVVPLEQAWNSAVDDRSMRLLTSIGVISTRAAVVPPAPEAVAERGCRTSWLKDSISIQSLCSLSLDSPLMVSMLRNACCMIWFPLFRSSVRLMPGPNVHHEQCPTMVYSDAAYCSPCCPGSLPRCRCGDCPTNAKNCQVFQALPKIDYLLLAGNSATSRSDT